MANRKWGEPFELGRAGANFNGSERAGRTGSGSSWVDNLPIGPPKSTSGRTRGRVKNGRPRKMTGGKPA